MAVVGLTLIKKLEMNIIKAYIILCLAVPVFTYEKTEEQTEETIETEIKEVAFWCDCGSSQHWKDKPLNTI